MFKNSPRFNSIHKIAQDLANANFQLFDKKDYKENGENAEAIDTPMTEKFFEFWENPFDETHPELDGFMLRYMAQALYMLNGEVFIAFETDGQGVPFSAYIIPSFWVIMTPCLVTNGMYRIMPLGNTSFKMVDVPPENIVYFKNPDFASPYGRGIGRAAVIGDEVETSEFIMKWQKSFFYNNAVPAWIGFLAGASEADIERIAGRWREKFSGQFQGHKMAWFPQKIEFQKLSENNREIGLDDTLKNLRDVCNEFYSIPPELHGIVENSNRATIDAADYLYKSNVLQPEVKRFLAVINKQLLPHFDETLTMQVVDLVPEDKKTKIDNISVAFKMGAATRADYKNAIGLDVEANDEVYYVPFNVQIVDAKKTAEQIAEDNKPEPVALPPAGKPKPTNGNSGKIRFVGRLDHLKALFLKSAFTDDKKVDLWKRIDSSATNSEEPFYQALRKYGNAQSKKLQETFKKYVNAGLDEQAAIEKGLSDIFGDKADELLADGFAPAWAESMKNGFDFANELLGGGLDFGTVNDLFWKEIADHGLEWAKTINDTTAERIKETMTEGMKAGESLAELTARVKEEYNNQTSEDKDERFRADRIARTESMRSMNEGQLITYASAGVEYKEWLATKDSRTRDTHAEADGQIVPIDEPFIVDGEELMCPGDDAGSAENVINCRCTLLPILDKAELEAETAPPTKIMKYNDLGVK